MEPKSAFQEWPAKFNSKLPATLLKFAVFLPENDSGPHEKRKIAKRRCYYIVLRNSFVLFAMSWVTFHDQELEWLRQPQWTSKTVCVPLVSELSLKPKICCFQILVKLARRSRSTRDKSGIFSFLNQLILFCTFISFHHSKKRQHTGQLANSVLA